MELPFCGFSVSTHTCRVCSKWTCSTVHACTYLILERGVYLLCHILHLSHCFLLTNTKQEYLWCYIQGKVCVVSHHHTYHIIGHVLKKEIQILYIVVSIFKILYTHLYIWMDNIPFINVFQHLLYTKALQHATIRAHNPQPL